MLTKNSLLYKDDIYGEHVNVNDMQKNRKSVQNFNSEWTAVMLSDYRLTYGRTYGYSGC